MIHDITMISNKCHGVSNHRSFYCLFNSLYAGPHEIECHISVLLALCVGNPPVTVGSPHEGAACDGGFPHKGAVTRKSAHVKTTSCP